MFKIIFFFQKKIRHFFTYFKLLDSNKLCHLDVLPCIFVNFWNQPPKIYGVVVEGLFSNVVEHVYNEQRFTSTTVDFRALCF